jgi:hypothetical protein
MNRVFAFLAALGGLMGFYGHRLGLPQYTEAPLGIGIALVSLALMAATRATATDDARAVYAPRQGGAAWILLWVGIGWATLSVGLSALGRSLSIEDLGVIALVLGMPFLAAAVDRQHVFLWILRLCLAFALVDAAANFLAVLDLVQLDFAGRIDEIGLVTRYPGLSGNTHAAGLVGFVGFAYLTFLTRRDGFSKSLKWLILAAIILISIVMIDARRYLAMALVCAGFMFSPARRIPLIAYTFLLAAVMLTLTFTAPPWDVGNYLRSELMLNGWYNSLGHPLIGEGLSYRGSADLIPTFEVLASAGVTESMVLEFAIAFGMVGALLFMTAPALAIVHDRNFTPMAIILAMLTAELFFGGSLRGGLGSMLYYCCLIGSLLGDSTFPLVRHLDRPQVAGVPAVAPRQSAPRTL